MEELNFCLQWNPITTKPEEEDDALLGFSKPILVHSKNGHLLVVYDMLEDRWLKGGDNENMTEVNIYSMDAVWTYAPTPKS